MSDNPYTSAPSADKRSPKIVDTGEIEITPEMIEAAAEELWDWVLRCGFNDTFSVDVARPQAEVILKAALRGKSLS